jgi:hypothetical protein
VTGLHVVHRSYGGENAKGRPSYYTKSLALASLLRTVAAADRPVEVIFVNDGEIPRDQMLAMEQVGELVPLPSVGGKRSFLTALAIPGQRRWPARDVVWFAEDDYLYHPSALRQLSRAADLAPDDDYFGLYALIGDRPPEGGQASAWVDVPKFVRTAEPLSVDGHCWRVGLATTGTLGTRVDAATGARRAFALSMVTASAWDYTASLAYQGYRPIPWQRLAGELRLGETSVNRRLRALGAVPGRVAVNLLAMRPRRRHPLLWAADPALCTHLESAHLALGTDWAAVAAETASWAQHRDIGLGVA